MPSMCGHICAHHRGRRVSYYGVQWGKGGGNLARWGAGPFKKSVCVNRVSRHSKSWVLTDRKYHLPLCDQFFWSCSQFRWFPPSLYGKNKEYQKEKKYPTFNFPVNYAAPGKFSESVAFAIFCGITKAGRDFQYPISICIVHTGCYVGCIASQTIKLVNLFYFTKEQFKRSLDTLRTGPTIRS